MSDLLGWLFARQRFGIKPGLERVYSLLERAGNPETRFETVLVGGTNGKGSTASTLASILTAAGRRTGLFTSPHLSYFSERFQIDGERVSAEVVEATLQTLKPRAEAVEATFFEIVTVLACQLFEKAGVETAVLEVGLGGRYDATNAIDPVLSILTNVSLDHMQVLGDSVEAIAKDKAGILRPGKRALTTATGAGLEVIRDEAARLGSQLLVLGADFQAEVAAATWAGLELSVTSPWGSVSVHSPLIGRHQAANVALAVTAAWALGLSNEAVEEGVRLTKWPGRLERLIYQNRTVLFDGAHNPAAAQTLRAVLAELGVTGFTLVAGVGQDKDVAGVLSPLVADADHVIFTKASSSPRAAEPTDLAEVVPGALLEPHPRLALERAVALTSEKDVIVVAGSLYLVGELRPYVLGEVGEGRVRWQ
ncbi:folylpolyglutamate synthase/dihydrofolate synthase family protein [soil metagenome]